MSKEKRQTETPTFDPALNDPSFSYANRLAIPQELKGVLKAKGLDCRFLNAQEFRANGGYHRSGWSPLNVREMIPDFKGITTAEGLVQRGDLILGVRTKLNSKKHADFLAEKNRRYSNFAQDEAKKMNDDIRRKGITGVRIKEGDFDDEKGFE